MINMHVTWNEREKRMVTFNVVTIHNYPNYTRYGVVVKTKRASSLNE